MYNNLKIKIDQAIKENVPDSVLFSGGIDSSAVLYTAHKYNPDVMAITVGVKGKETSDIKYSKMEQDFSDINERNDFDMNTLLIFFALPIAVIVISIALQKILKCPLLVSAIIFSIFLIVTFVVNNLNFLVAAIIYAIISFITAFLTYIICKFLDNYRENICRNNSHNCNEDRQNELLTISSRYKNNENGDLLTISSGCNGNTNELLTISSNANRRNNNCSNCCNNSSCNCDSNNDTVNLTNGVSARINVIPNNTNNGQTGCISGCYRRRC